MFLHLLYAGVTKKYRCQGVFSGLIENVKKFNTPLTAVVKHSNQSNMAGRLTKRGFARFQSRIELAINKMRFYGNQVSRAENFCEAV